MFRMPLPTRAREEMRVLDRKAANPLVYLMAERKEKGAAEKPRVNGDKDVEMTDTTHGAEEEIALRNALDTAASAKAAVSDPGVEAIERNAAKTMDFKRHLPKLIVIEVRVNEQPVRALIDTGSMADFISTTVADQLRLKTDVLAKPLPLQLAVHGSRSKVTRPLTTCRTVRAPPSQMTSTKRRMRTTMDIHSPTTQRLSRTVPHSLPSSSQTRHALCNLSKIHGIRAL